MASIANDGNGRRRILFIDASGVRRTIRLGKVEKRHAERARDRIESIVSATVTRSPIDGETAAWLTDIDDVLHEKLAAVGLVNPRQGRGLIAWCDYYIASRQLKPESARKLEQTKAKLKLYFGEDKRLHEITPDDAARWRESLTGLSEAAVKTHVGNAKSLMGEAVRRELIRSNPFTALKGGTTAAKDVRYVTREEIAKVIDAAPDAEWKLLLGLARYAGLRTPSETSGLTWADVDFAAGKLTVKSPKTERFVGKEKRIVPVIPPLMALLQARFDSAQDGEERLVTIKGAGSRRREMIAIAARAGVVLWSDCWQSLRRSAEIDFNRDFPAFVAAKWLGHSLNVSAKHYTTTVPDELYERAARKDAAQNAAQQSSESSRSEAQTPTPEPASEPEPVCENAEKGRGLRESARECASDPANNQEWSRGESNPRPVAVGARLYACIGRFDLGFGGGRPRPSPRPSPRCFLAGDPRGRRISASLKSLSPAVSGVQRGSCRHG